MFYLYDLFRLSFRKLLHRRRRRRRRTNTFALCLFDFIVFPFSAFALPLRFSALAFVSLEIQHSSGKKRFASEKAIQLEFCAFARICCMLYMYVRLPLVDNK